MVADANGVVDETRLLKVLKKSAVLGDLEKEWAIGQALNVLSNKVGAVLPAQLGKTHFAAAG